MRPMVIKPNKAYFKHAPIVLRRWNRSCTYEDVDIIIGDGGEAIYEETM